MTQRAVSGFSDEDEEGGKKKNKKTKRDKPDHTQLFKNVKMYREYFFLNLIGKKV